MNLKKRLQKLEERVSPTGYNPISKVIIYKEEEDIERQIRERMGHGDRGGRAVYLHSKKLSIKAWEAQLNGHDAEVASSSEKRRFSRR